MPIYEYECLKCGKQFEVWQKFSDEPVKVCKYCGGPVRKLVSLSSFHLKGSGWYATDYKGKVNGAGAKRGRDKESGKKEEKKE